MRPEFKGIAFLLFGIIVSFGTVIGLWFCRLIGLLFGIMGLMYFPSDKYLNYHRFNFRKQDAQNDKRNDEEKTE